MSKRREPFEDLYRKLEDTVEKLEQGGLSLDDSIALYEQGMTLAKRCQELLDEAEQKITRLRQTFAERPGYEEEELEEDEEEVDEP